ncbi:hypothetical protein RRSWK_03279 [Rhodopirellula sp. SWK7]|nr:hypothetical protein RRSWK_03279 [Rhodopirellula sp. SWK7]
MRAIVVVGGTLATDATTPAADFLHFGLFRTQIHQGVNQDAVAVNFG